MELFRLKSTAKAGEAELTRMISVGGFDRVREHSMVSASGLVVRVRGLVTGHGCPVIAFVFARV